MSDEDIDGVSHNGLRRIYRVLCHMAWCDRDMASSERALLDAFRLRYGIEKDEAEKLEYEGKQTQKLGIGRRDAERRLLADAMVDVASADGVLATTEQKRLLKVGEKLGLGDRELAKLIHERAVARGKRLQPDEQVGQ